MQKQPTPRPGIYLLPNLLTTLGLFAAFYAVVAAVEGHFSMAAKAIFVAILTDMLDGQVARMTHTYSDFGKQYDSLVDMVAFGFAPAILVYMWALSALNISGWLAAFLYVAASALRLARFNVQPLSLQKRYFQGLTSPVAAALLAGAIWTGEVGQWQDSHPLWVQNSLFLMTILLSALMVSTIRYRSYKDMELRNKVPFVAILAMIMLIVLIAYHPPAVLFGLFLIYAVSGPWRYTARWRKKRKLKRQRALRGKPSSG